MEWKEEYSVGHEQIDNEHKQFIRLVSQLEEMNTLTDKSSLLVHLDELEAYTHFHFTNEEKTMQQAGYPGFTIHQKLHEKLLITLGKNLKEIKAEQKSVYELIQFLVKWFIFHTSSEDKKFTRYLKN